MPATTITTDHIDYLQRNFLGGAISGSQQFVGISRLQDLSLVHIAGIAQFWQDSNQKAVATRQNMADALAGLHAQQIPIAFLVLGAINQMNLYLGTFRAPQSSFKEEPIIGRNAIEGVLRSGFPGISLLADDGRAAADIIHFIESASGYGILTGIPTEKLGTSEVGVEQMERLVRGMYGRQWGYMVIATPLPSSDRRQLFNDALVEQATIEESQSSVAQTAISTTYYEMVKAYKDRLAAAQSGGLWRVTPYIFGTSSADYVHLKAVAQSVFGGALSFPEPLRILNCHEFGKQIAYFGQIITPTTVPAPGRIRHQNHFATLLNSSELSTLAHLPMEEMPGYFVREYTRFDVAPGAQGSKRFFSLGDIIDFDQPSGNRYALETDSLVKHCLIAGLTGTGKTNTIFHILKEAWKQKVPFLVIEPAKAEYRELLDEQNHAEVGNALRIFTLGDELVSPFRLNPFEVQPGVSVQTHIDLLRAVFNASFSMYGPMPQLLEQCIHAIYRDRGWNLVTGENYRGVHHLSWPTLTDLYYKIDVIVDQAGYGERIGPDLRAALKVRINSLRSGGKGLMLDTPSSIPMQMLLNRPTVLELEAIGDDDEKAFVMGVVWLFLYEHRRAFPVESKNSLRHLLVIEEAHRLLTNIPPSTNPEIANTRGKAVETFSNILSEIRASGQGIIIADQIPSRLAPDVIKNTSLKIAHRLVAEDERNIIGGAMNMDEVQTRYLATLDLGWAAIFSEGDDRPMLVKVAASKQPDSEMLIIDNVPSSNDALLQDIDIGLTPDNIELIDEEHDDIAIFESEQEMGDTEAPNFQVFDMLEIELELPSEENGGNSQETNLLSVNLETDLPLASKTGSSTPKEPEITVDIDSDKDQFELDIPQVIEDVLASNSATTRSLTEAELHIKTHMRQVFLTDNNITNVLNVKLTDAAELHWLDLAKEISAKSELREAMSRLLLSAAHDSFEPFDSISFIRQMVRKFSQRQSGPQLERTVLALLAHDAFRRLGDDYGWPYDAVERLESMWLSVTAATDPVAGQITIEDQEDVLKDYRILYRQLAVRQVDPYPVCETVCDHGLCLYRFQAAALLGNTPLNHRYITSYNEKGQDQSVRNLTIEAQLRRVGRSAAEIIVDAGVAEKGKDRAAACYLIQKGDTWELADHAARQRAIARGVRSILDAR